jgi:N-acylneuraminate cytidylyltransferase
MPTLAIIPARGASKGIPRKNLVETAGRPLIAWSIRQALQSDRIDRTLVTTDDKEIAAVSRDWGAEAPFLRPAELATDVATTESALFHALDWLEAKEGYVPDRVVLLQPTCPVRKAGSIDDAIRLFINSGADSLVGVREIHPFLWSKPHNARAHYDYLNRPRRQDVLEDERIYEETGCLYMAKTTIMRASGNRLGGRVVLFPMDPFEAVDIDVPSDVILASAVLRAMQPT